MSYIIVAEVDTEDEDNYGGDAEKLSCRKLCQRGTVISFDIPGDFKFQKELTFSLCKELIEAGFISFSIHHSY